MIDDIKCVKCKYFNPYEFWCEKDQDEQNCDNCQLFEEDDLDIEEFLCSNCAYREDGECIFDLQSPITCNHFKSLKED